MLTVFCPVELSVKYEAGILKDRGPISGYNRLFETHGYFEVEKRFQIL